MCVVFWQHERKSYLYLSVCETEQEERCYLSKRKWDASELLIYTKWPNVCGNLTTTSTSDPSPKCCHKARSNQLYRISLYAWCLTSLMRVWLNGQITTPHSTSRGLEVRLEVIITAKQRQYSYTILNFFTGVPDKSLNRSNVFQTSLLFHKSSSCPYRNTFLYKFNLLMKVRANSEVATFNTSGVMKKKMTEKM